jgi:hypothetical protein
VLTNKKQGELNQPKGNSDEKIFKTWSVKFCMNLVVMYFTIHFHDTVDAANFKGIGIWCIRTLETCGNLKGQFIIF